MEENVTLTIKNGIARIVIDRAEKNNSLTFPMIEKIVKMCDALQWENEKDVRFCVIEGKCDFFCSGLDIDQFSGKRDFSKEDFFENAMKQAKLLRQIASLPFPVISKIKGGALGLGLGLVAVSDCAIAEENSIFGTPEVKIGIPPAMTSLYVLRKTTLSNLSLLSLSGEIIGAQEALSSGLVNRLFAMESFDEESDKVEGDLLEAGPSALRKMKNIILKNSPVPTSEMEEFAATQIAEAMESEEFKEGISSLMEKKTPNWVIRKDK